MSEQVQIHRVFDNVHAHQRIADLIQRYSTNKQGVHRTALKGLDLAACRRILDLGCAFGSFTEKLKGMVGSAAMATGVDAVRAYEPLYLAACARAGIRGRFSPAGISVLQTFADQSFDLILCSYALYFFPEAIPEIARLLSDDGVFIAITHHRRNTGELIRLTKETLDAIGLYHEKHLPLEIITGRFSSENGLALLQPWFGGIRMIDFPNRLVFPKGEIESLTEYFRFKSPLYFTDTGLDMEALLPTVLERLARAASRQNGMSISKDDCIFVCMLPRQGKEKS
jgi:ubiquinone/menaquinone biosynthesis C-methylase UbiE